MNASIVNQKAENQQSKTQYEWNGFLRHCRRLPKRTLKRCGNHEKGKQRKVAAMITEVARCACTESCDVTRVYMSAKPDRHLGPRRRIAVTGSKRDSK